MDRLNILSGSSVLTLLCAIHSRSTLGVTFGSGWKLEQLAKSNHFTSFIAPTISCTSIETKWFHVLTLIGYSSHFVSLYPISVLISSQGLCSLEQIPLQSTIPPNAPSPVHHRSKYPLFIIPSHPWHPPSPHVTQCTILIIFTTFCKLNTFISKFPLFTYYSSHSILQTKHWMVKSWKRSYSIV
jgi:hypothetical protein